jgi:hypothetical protein
MSLLARPLQTKAATCRSRPVNVPIWSLAFRADCAITLSISGLARRRNAKAGFRLPDVFNAVPAVYPAIKQKPHLSTRSLTKKASAVFTAEASEISRDGNPSDRLKYQTRSGGRKMPEAKYAPRGGDDCRG